MLKAVYRGERGLLVVLGLSSPNLELLHEGRSIQFPASDVELGEGVFVLAHASDREIPSYRGLVGSFVRALVVLDDAAFRSLRRGEPIEMELGALGIAEPGSLFILYGETERALLAAIAGAGLVPDGTEIELQGLAPSELGTPIDPPVPREVRIIRAAAIVLSTVGALAVFAIAATARTPIVFVACGIALACGAAWLLVRGRR